MRTVSERIQTFNGDYPVFFPAVSCATVTYLNSNTDEELIEKYPNIVKSFRFWNASQEKDAYFTHPFVLMSAGHMYKIPDIRKHLTIDNDAVLFIDSGGYSLASGALSEKKWDNERAFEWSMNNGDIFPILDRPTWGDNSFEESLEKTIESAEYYKANLPENHGKIVLNVVHGRDLKEVDHWIESIQHLNFDGWAIGSIAGGNPIRIAKTIIKLMKAGALTKESKVLHCFGVSGTTNMIYFSIIQQELRKLGYQVRITFDSSYFQRSFAFGHFFMFKKFDGMVNITLSNKYDYSNLPHNMKHPCSCHICEQITDLNSYFNTSLEFYLLGLAHNLDQMLTYKRSVDTILSMGIEPLIQDAMPAKIYRNIQALRKSFQNLDGSDTILSKEFKHKQIKEGGANLDEFFS